MPATSPARTTKAVLASLLALSGAYWSGVILGFRWGHRAGWDEAAQKANRLLELGKKKGAT